MKKGLSSLLLLFFIFQAGAQTNPFPEIEQYKLPNGLRVYLIDYGNLPATSISLYVNCGKKNETPGRQYLSQLAATSVNLGCDKYDHEALDNKLFQLGTAIGAEAGEDYTTISSSFLNTNLEDGFDVFSQAVLHPTFPQRDLNQIISQLVDYNNPAKVDITQQAAIFSQFWIYGASNPVGRYFYKEQLLKMTADTIKEFYKFNYTPANSRLMICGKLDKEKLKVLIEKYFGSWVGLYGEVNGVSFENPVIKKKEYAFVNRSKATQAALHWTKNGPDTKSKDVIPFLVANSAFNEVLMKEIREKEGKTYGINSYYSYYSNSNLLTISTQVRNTEMMNTVNLLDKVLQNFSTNGITAQEMEKAKKQLRNEWLMIENPVSVMGFFNPFVFPKPELRKNYLAEIDNLTLDDVNKVLKKYFTPDNFRLMIAGDQQELQDQLNLLKGLKIFNPKDIEVSE